MSYVVDRALPMLARAALVLALTELPCAAARADEDSSALFHAFRIAPKGATATVSLSFDSGWHVDSVDGPPVDPAQMRYALTSLASVTIGGRCVGPRDGLTLYPCGFAMAGLEIDGIAAERLTGIAVRGRTLSFAMRETASPSTATQLVKITASLPGLDGDAGARFDGRMKFHWRSLSSKGHPAKVDADSGVVELRYRPAPGPARHT